MSRASGTVRINVEALERVLGEQATSQRASEAVRATLRTVTGAAFCVFDADLRLVFAEGDALQALGVDVGIATCEGLGEDLREAFEAALAGERLQIDLQRGEQTYELYAAPVLGDGATAIAGTAIALDVTDDRYVQMRMRRRAKGQAELTALSRRAADEAELPQLLQQACDAVAQTLEVDRVSVQEMDEASGQLVMAAGFGWPPDVIRSASLPLTDERRASFLSLSAGAEVLDDVSTREPDGPQLAAAGFASMLTALIGDADRAYGTLHAIHLTPRMFNEQESAFVQAIANILWSAIERSEAAETHRRAELHDPTTGLASHSLMRERLQQALERARAEQCATAVLLIDVDEFMSSTTPSAARAATPCCAPSPRACRPRRAIATPSLASAATSSRSSARASSQRRRRSTSPSASRTPSASRSTCTAAATSCARASASSSTRVAPRRS